MARNNFGRISGWGWILSRPVLVTGAHRTGTTWVGKMLVASGEAGYISEPFNLLHRPGVMRAKVAHWYPYICADNEAGILTAMQEMLRFNYHPWLELGAIQSAHDAMRMGRDWRDFSLARMRRSVPLVKDPFALFSIPWMIERLNFKVVVTVRHPAAFASSLKRLDWPFEIEDLLEQPLLVRDWLAPFEKELNDLTKNDPEHADIIGRASLLWRMIYTTVEKLISKFPETQLVRHEDLAIDPVEGFSNLYQALGLKFTSRAQKTVIESSRAENPIEASTQNIYATRLDSAASLSNWKRRLKGEEIERIRLLTAGILNQIYSDKDWV